MQKNQLKTKLKLYILAKILNNEKIGNSPTNNLNFKFYFFNIVLINKKTNIINKKIISNELNLYNNKTYKQKKTKHNAWLNYLIKLQKKAKQKNIKKFTYTIKYLKKLNLYKKTKSIKVNKKTLFNNKPKLITSNAKYQIIFNNIFYKLFKKKVIVANINYFIKTKIKKFSNIIKKILTKHHFLKKTIVTYKIIKILFASVIYKDSSLLILVIKNMFENVHYSKHRIYFNFWLFLIKSFLSYSLKKLNIFGLKLEFHGKLGVGGNSKKRSNYYHIGRCSNSSKIFKIDSSHSFFKTATGVVGFTYTIFY